MTTKKSEQQARATVKVPKVRNFEVTGDGTASAWKKAPWLALQKVGGKTEYQTRAKIVYSATGLYVLFECEDDHLTCSGKLGDMGNLFTEDVVEFFVWPNEEHPVYFEYEISPLNKELVILVPNHKGNFFGWLPWHYHKEERRTRHATKVFGGAKKPGAKVAGWSAEFFVPFELITSLGNVPPKKGTQWRANFYRIDYDKKSKTQYAWEPALQPNGNFHDYESFGILKF